MQTAAELQQEVESALGTSTLTPLTAGGQKQVFTASLGGVPVVVKIVAVPQETGYADHVVRRAQREVELLSSIESDYVVRVLSEAVEVGDRPEALCWVEEYLDGKDLRELTSSLPWTEEATWRLIHDMARGLAACHDLDVVHRDLSPGNVRRCDDGRFVLMDPGLARHLTKTAMTGVFQPGTFGHMSPEHVPGGHPTPASDVFGVGILAYQALTGALPVPYLGDEGTYFVALYSTQVPSVATVAPHLSPDLVAVVDRCLQRQPARRYLDASELLSDLPPSWRSTRGPR